MTSQQPGESDPNRLVVDQSYSLPEAARLTGLSVDALRSRIKRGRLQGFTGNDGTRRVRLTTADLEALRLARPAPDDQPATSHELASDQSVEALMAAMTSLGEALTRQAERADQMAAERDEARQAHADGRERLVVVETALRTEADRATRAEAALIEARRPWLVRIARGLVRLRQQDGQE